MISRSCSLRLRKAVGRGRGSFLQYRPWSADVSGSFHARTKRASERERERMSAVVVVLGGGTVWYLHRARRRMDVKWLTAAAGLSAASRELTFRTLDWFAELKVKLELELSRSTSSTWSDGSVRKVRACHTVVDAHPNIFSRVNVYFA